MSARLLNPRSSILTLTLELRYTISRCQANPKASFCVPVFQPLRDECSIVQQQELDLLEALSNAQANVDVSDENLDDFASRLAKALLTITKDDRSHTLYLHFFGKKPLSTFLRPKLGLQLESMRPWHESLKTSTFAALQAMVPELDTLIAAADKAVGARTETQNLIRKFRDVGARRQLFDKVNAARKKAHGDLAKLAIETPGLPSDFPDGFFRSAPAVEDVNEPTAESVTQDISDLEAKVVAAKDQLTALQAAAALAQKAADEKAGDQAQLDALEKQESELAKQKAALKQKLAKK
jgi:hypothetical protein